MTDAEPSVKRLRGCLPAGSRITTSKWRKIPSSEHAQHEVTNGINEFALNLVVGPDYLGHQGNGSYQCYGARNTKKSSPILHVEDPSPIPSRKTRQLWAVVIAALLG